MQKFLGSQKVDYRERCLHPSDFLAVQSTIGGKVRQDSHLDMMRTLNVIKLDISDFLDDKITLIVVTDIL